MTLHGSVLGGLAGAALLAAAACGGGSGTDDGSGGLAAGSPGGVRTVRVAMVDNAFSPSRVEVERGERVRFVFTNDGSVTHDAVLGDEAAQAAHAAEMAEAAAASGGAPDGTEGGTDGGMESTEGGTGGGMESTEGGADGGMEGMDHGTEGGGEGGAITLQPGETGELAHTFARDEAVLIGCHEPGHYEAGMRLSIDLAGG